MSAKEKKPEPAPCKGITADWVVSWINEFSEGPLNTMHLNDEPAWDTPLVAFSSGSDPLYAEFPEHIGDFYWTPQQAFSRVYPDVPAEELTVISWVLPQTKATKLDNRKQDKYPAERWARSRKFGEEFNDALHDTLVKALTDAGVNAMAPSRHEDWEWLKSEQVGITSTWSHRHAAYVAGLGTFGLCDALITPAGKAMRCGSIIARINIPPTPRPYQDRNAYCLYFAKGTCGACMRRCPVGAITPEGHNKEACKKYVLENTKAYVKEEIGFDIYGCGLCQVGVPCESCIPKVLRPE